MAKNSNSNLPEPGKNINRKSKVVFMAILCVALGVVAAIIFWPADNSPYANTASEAVAPEEDLVHKASEAFMADIEKQADVKPLGGGVFYKELVAGNGPKPTQDSKVRVNYEGRLIDGTVFDSSYERGQAATFPVGGVIQGWQIALKAMPVGSTWEVYIPQYYAYGAQGSGEKIPPYSALVFKVELLGIE